MGTAHSETPERERAFAPRALALGSAGRLLRETVAILAVAPGRLVGLYLLVYLPLQLLIGSAYLAMPLRAILASIGFAGFFCALDTARSGRLPGLRDLAGPWRLPRDKLVLLALGGLVPVLLVWLAWWLDLGSLELDKLLTAPLVGAADPAAGSPQGEPAAFPGVSDPALAQKIEAVLVENLAGIPLLLLQPLCVLYPWSATRTFSANLLASLSNWRWGVLLAVLLMPIGLVLYSFHSGSLIEDLLLLLVDVAVDIFLNAFTLVLLRQALVQT